MNYSYLENADRPYAKHRYMVNVSCQSGYLRKYLLSIKPATPAIPMPNPDVNTIRTQIRSTP